MTQTEPPTAPAPEPAAATGPRRRKRWSVARWCALLLVLPGGLVLLAVAFAIERPMPVPAWVAEEIEVRADQVLAGGALEVGTISVTLGRDLHPRVRMTDIRLRDAAGASLARIPVVEALFSPRGMILRREALIQDLLIGGAQVNLSRLPDGAVALSFEPGSGPVEAAPGFLDLLDQSDALFDLPALAALETIRAEGLIVNYTDLRAGRSWTVDGGRLTLDVRGGMTRLDADLAVLSGGAGITTLAASYESPRGSPAATFAVAIDDARAADIAAQSPALSWLAGVSAPVSARLAGGRTADGALAPLTGDLVLGTGALQPNPATTPIGFEEARVALAFDPGQGLIRFTEIAVAGDLGRARAEGQMILGPLRNGLPQSLVGQFRLADVALARPGGADPIALDRAQVDIKLDLAPFALTFGAIYAETASLALHGTGAMRATDLGWQTAFDISLPDASHADMLALWPAGQMPGVRSWSDWAIADTARYSDLQVSLRKAPDGPLRVAGSLGFADLDLRYLETMPPITAGRGTASFTDAIFAVALDSGTVTAPTGGTVDLAGSTMTIPDLKAAVRPAQYDLRLRGPIPAMLSLTDLPPMGYMTAAGLGTDVATGSAVVRMDLRHPLKETMTGAEVAFSASADLSGVSSSTLIAGRDLRADSLRLTMDKTAIEIAGRATVDGLPLDASFEQVFGAGTGGRLQGQARVSDAGLRAFGIALPPGTVSGEGTVSLNLSFPPGAAPRYDISSDLVGLRVAVPAVGWAKPPGTAGRLELTGRLGASPAVESLVIAGGGLDVRGDVTFTPAGGLDRARLSQVRIGDWLNAPITLRGRGAGLLPAVVISGGVIDLRRARFGEGAGAAGGPVSIALDRLQVTEGIALTNFAGDFTSQGGFAGQFEAGLNGAGRVRGSVVPRNGASAVRIVSDDAGAVARASGLIRTAVGGSLDLTLLPTGADGTFDGWLAIRDLRIRDAPAIAALLDAISVVGLLQQLDGQGLAFEAVDARFRITPQQVIVTESSAVGPGLGISLDGIYTLASQQMDFQGVISPFYLINSIGSIFTRRGEGLIGFNFTIRGTGAAPVVGVNPLSALTPGMFREIFRREPPQVTQ